LAINRTKFNLKLWKFDIFVCNVSALTFWFLCFWGSAAIYPAAGLDGLARYVRVPNGARRYRLKACLCGGTKSRDTTAAEQLTTSTLASRESRIASRQVSYLLVAANSSPILYA